MARQHERLALAAKLNEHVTLIRTLRPKAISRNVSIR